MVDCGTAPRALPHALPAPGGEVEIVVPASTRLTALGLDGVERWRASIADGSGLAGCSLFDADADGAHDDGDLVAAAMGKSSLQLVEEELADKQA